MVIQLIFGVFVYSTGAEVGENREPLEAELQEAKNHMELTSLEHKQLLRVLENIKNHQQVGLPQLTVIFGLAMSSVYCMHV